MAHTVIKSVMGAPDLAGHKDIRRERDRWRAKETAAVASRQICRQDQGCKNMMAKS